MNRGDAVRPEWNCKLFSKIPYLRLAGDRDMGVVAMSSVGFSLVTLSFVSCEALNLDIACFSNCT